MAQKCGIMIATMQHSELFLKYCNAMVNFYGRIPVIEAYEIIKLQNGEQITLDDLFGFLVKINNRDTSKDRTESCFFLYTEEDYLTPFNSDIVHECFETDCFEDPSSDNNDYERLVEVQSLSPRYVPPKNELLKYASDEYYEDSPELQAVVDWVLNHQRKLPFPLEDEDIICEVTLPLTMESDPESALEDLVKWINLPKDEDKQDALLEELFSLIFALHRNTREWFLNGHKPRELPEQG